MSLTKRFQEIFDSTTENQNKIDSSVSVCKETAIHFSGWLIEKHKKYPDAVLRYDKLFDLYEKEQESKIKSMIPPKQKAEELFRKISALMELNHNEILEVLDFLLETKIIQENIKSDDLAYWNSVRVEAKKIK